MKRIRGTIAEVMRTTFNADNMLLAEIRFAEGKAIERGDEEQARRYDWMERAAIKFMQKAGVKNVRI